MRRPAYYYCLSLLFASLLCMQMVRAEGDIRISNAWINEAPPGMKMMGGYLDVSNNTGNALVLIGASSPCFEQIEFHITEIKNGVSTMRKQESVTIPAGAIFSFSPGHYHLMLINNTRDLGAGDKVPLTFKFAEGGPVQVDAEIRRRAPTAHQHH